MKRLTIMLLFVVALVGFSNANANFIGPYNYPVTFQKSNGGTTFFFNHISFLKYRGNEWLDLTRLKCLRNCSDSKPITDGASTAVPEPSTMLLTLLGLAGLGASRRRKQ